MFDVTCAHCNSTFQVYMKHYDSVIGSDGKRVYCCEMCAVEIIGNDDFAYRIRGMGISRSRAENIIKSIGRPAINVSCVHCKKPFRVSMAHHKSTLVRGTRIYCCDDCAVKFVAECHSKNELEERGVSYNRARSAGFKATVPCKVCGFPINFKSSNRRFRTLTYCYRPECPSVHFTGNRSKSVTKHYERTGEPACKVVVCNPMNEKRDAMLRTTGAITVDEFNETRRTIMARACKEYVKPSAMAFATFILTMERLGMPTRGFVNRLAKVAGCSEVCGRTYVNKYRNVLGLKVPKKRKR